ncbi:SBBP repeat-containing protein [Sorangium sp. So ce1099]|uniref:SBBP repeat-containing protein n=1 Tax=Sorangium sp. So ce1099 TaxID=3133331 RepID=UPI003F60ED14
MFVLKLDPAGHAIWSRQFGGLDTETGTNIALDASGNILLGGVYSGPWHGVPGPPVDFGGGPLPWDAEFISLGAFVVKLDPDGNHLWSHGYTPGTDGQVVRVRDLATDTTGNSAAILVYPANTYGDSVDIGVNVFRFSAEGGRSPFFSHRTYESAPGGVAMDSAGNVLIALGHAEAMGRRCPCDYYFHVEKRDPAGTVLWRKLLSGPDASGDGGEAKDIAVDPEDNILVVGRSLGNLDLGGGPIANGTHFVVKMSPLGDYLWHRESPSDAVVTDSVGNVIVLGEQSLVKLDASGTALWRRTFTDMSATITGLTSCRDDHIALVGEFTGTADFGTGPLTAAGQDGFVAVLAP